MRHVFLLFISFFFLDSINPQIYYGLKAGIAINNFTNRFSSNEKELLSIQSAVFAKIHLHQLIIFQPSIGYYPKGIKLEESFFLDSYGNAIPVSNEKTRFDYIELALPFQYIIADKKFPVAVGFGPFVSYAVSGEVTFEYKPGQLIIEPTNRPIAFGIYGYNRFDAGVVTMLSTFLGKHWTGSINYDQGLTYTSYYGKQKTISVGITVGYIFK